MNQNKAIIKNNFVNGILIDVFLIFIGVLFFLYLFTFSGQGLDEKIEFYSTASGLLISLVVFIFPLILSFSNRVQKRQEFWIRFSLVVGFQIIVVSFIPLIGDFTDEAFEAIKVIIENSQNSGNLGK